MASTADLEMREVLKAKIKQSNKSPYHPICKEKFILISFFHIRKYGFEYRQFEKDLINLVHKYYEVKQAQFQTLIRIESIQQCDFIDFTFVMIRIMDIHEKDLILLPKYQMITIIMKNNLDGYKFKKLDKREWRDLFGQDLAIRRLPCGRLFKLKRLIDNYFKEESHQIDPKDIKTINI